MMRRLITGEVRQAFAVVFIYIWFVHTYIGNTSSRIHLLPCGNISDLQKSIKNYLNFDAMMTYFREISNYHHNINF